MKTSFEYKVIRSNRRTLALEVKKDLSVIVRAPLFLSDREIAAFAEKMVPLMALIYIIGSLTIIIGHYDMIAKAFEMIIVGAFDPVAATGGVVGAGIKEAIRYGVARGLFSNEAGMGSTPHAHAVARVKHPAEQGLAFAAAVFRRSVSALSTSKPGRQTYVLRICTENTASARRP